MPASDPDILLLLLAIRLYGHDDVLDSLPIFKALKDALQSALSSKLVQSEKRKVPTGKRTKAGKLGMKSVSVLSLTELGEQFLAGQADPSVVATGRMAVLREAQNQLASTSQAIELAINESLQRINAIAEQQRAMIDQLIEQALSEGVSHNSPPSSTPNDQPPPHRSLDDAIISSYRSLRLRREYEDGLIDLPRLYDKTKLSNPDLSLEQFHKCLLQLWKETSLQLRMANEVAHVPQQEKGIWYKDEFYYYAYLPEKK